MKHWLLKMAAPFGLMIYAIYTIGNRYNIWSGMLPNLMCIVSIAFMMTGLIYNGWCLGRRINPNAKKKAK